MSICHQQKRAMLSHKLRCNAMAALGFLCTASANAPCLGARDRTHCVDCFRASSISQACVLRQAVGWVQSPWPSGRMMQYHKNACCRILRPGHGEKSMVLGWRTSRCMSTGRTASMRAAFESRETPEEQVPGSRTHGLVTKQIYQEALQCARLAWHRRHRLVPDEVFSDTERYLMEQGIAFEDDYLAQNYTSGTRVDSINLKRAAADTVALMSEIHAAGHQDRSRGASTVPSPPPEDSSNDGPAHHFFVRPDGLAEGTKTPGDRTRVPPPSAERGHAVPAIFQATFLSPGEGVAKADVLEYVGGGEWDVVEVKSCSERHVDAYLLDLAFTVYVATRAGVNIRRAALVAASSDYRFGMARLERFARIDMTDKVFDAMGILQDLAGNGEPERSFHWVDAATSTSTSPPAAAIPFCKKCPMFRECISSSLEHPVWELPRLTGKRFYEIAGQSLEVRDAPTALLTKAQAKFQECVRVGTCVIDDKGLARGLGRMVTPYYYLDFESVSPLDPPFESVAPWQTIVTQFSVHVTHSVGSGLEHSEYLADPTRDCREELAQALIRDLGSHGSIVVYSSYEKTQINALAELLPHLAEPLHAIVERLVDLEKIIKEYVAHPEFRGRSSLKVTLPVLVPAYEQRYAQLTVANGADAATAFERLASPETPHEERDQIRRNLLEYCELDTLAMVELHAALYQLAHPVGAT